MPLTPLSPAPATSKTLTPPASKPTGGLAAPASGLAAPAAGATNLAVPTPAAPTAAAPTPAPAGLKPPTTKVAAARARYTNDGQASMSKPQLLVALYQRLVRDLLAAEKAIPARDYEAASKNLQHAQDIVLALEEALDRDAWDTADQLGALYAYVYQQLLQANIRKDVDLVVECRKLIVPLEEAWSEAATAVAAGHSPAAADALDLNSSTAIPA